MKTCFPFSQTCHFILFSKPKVGLPVSRKYNQCVSLDLRERRQNKCYILYVIDTFSRLTRAQIIKNKEPMTIVKAVMDIWVLGRGTGPGIPDRFIFDNGKEHSSKID